MLLCPTFYICLKALKVLTRSLLLMLLMRTRRSRLGKSAGLYCKDERRAREMGSPAAGTGTGAAASFEATAGPEAGTSARERVVSSWHQSRCIWHVRWKHDAFNADSRGGV